MNGIFTTQTRSADAEPVYDEPGEESESSQSMTEDPDVRTSTVEKVSAASAGKDSDSTVTHTAPVLTGDETKPVVWYTLLADALAGIAAVFTLNRKRRRAAGSHAKKTV